MASDQQNFELSDITNNLISEFKENYFPSNLDVLKRLLYKTRNEKHKVADAVKVVIKEVISIWDKSSIKVKRIDHCNEKLQKLYNYYAEVRKFQGKPSKKVTDFLKEMSNVFDISQDTLILLLGSMNDEVKKAFLSKPVEYIKNRLAFIESGNMSGN